VVLFSDNPSDDVVEQVSIKNEQAQIISTIEKGLADDIKYISMKICDSDWTDLPFDETKLQGESILLKDKVRRTCTNSMYEIVANV
jgi:hypothetical protein